MPPIDPTVARHSHITPFPWKVPSPLGFYNHLSVGDFLIMISSPRLLPLASDLKLTASSGCSHRHFRLNLTKSEDISPDPQMCSCSYTPSQFTILPYAQTDELETEHLILILLSLKPQSQSIPKLSSPFLPPLMSKVRPCLFFCNSLHAPGFLSSSLFPQIHSPHYQNVSLKNSQRPCHCPT